MYDDAYSGERDRERERVMMIVRRKRNHDDTERIQQITGIRHSNSTILINTVHIMQLATFHMILSTGNINK